MKKFMIFLLMAFLYLGTCYASNESASLSNDVGKSLRHWIAPSLGSPAGDEFSLPLGIGSSELSDSTVRVYLVGPTTACPGQVITLTAIVENNYLGNLSYTFRRNGNILTEVIDPVYPNRIQITVPETHGLDSLIQEFDVRVTQDCHSFTSPVFYLRVNSIHVTLDSLSVCDTTSKALMCAQVFSNGAEAPYAYAWYKSGATSAFDTTYTPCKLLPVGNYFVEPHFTWNACVAKSQDAKVYVGEGPADGHLKLDGLTATACNGNQVVATLSGLSKKYGQPSITWTLNGHAIYTAQDSVVSFSPLTIAGSATNYILKATVSYENYDCKEYTVQDTIKMLPDPTVAIYGDAVICAGTAPELTAVLNGYLADTTYIWKVDGVRDTTSTNVFTKKLSPRNYPYEISLIVTDSVSCTAVSEPFMLYVDTANTVKLLSSASVVCKNDVMVTLNANVENAAIPGLSYQWFQKVGSAEKAVIANAITSTYTTALTDTTTFYVTVTNPTSSCYATDSVTVNVYKDVPVAKELVLQTSNTSLCDGGQVKFFVKDNTPTLHPDAVVSYTWTVNGVELPNVTGNTYMPVMPAVGVDSTIYTIHVVANYQLQCKDTSLVLDTVVKVYPTPSVSIIKTERYYCNTDPLVFHPTAVLDGYVPNATYTWYVDGVKVNTSSNSVLNGLPLSLLPSKPYNHELDPYELTVVVTDSASCTATSEPVSFYFIPTHKLQVDIIASADTLCKDSLVTLTPRIIWYASQPPYTSKQLDPSEFNIQWNLYPQLLPSTSAWYVPSNFVAPEITTQLKETTEYTLTFSFGDGYCKREVKKTIYVYKPQPLYPIVLQTSNASLCDGGQVTFTVKDTNAVLYPNAAVSYQWIVNGVEMPPVTGNTYMPSMPAITGDSTIYNVHVVANYQLHCSDASLTVDTAVKVFNTPTVSIYGDAIVCNPNGRIELSAVVSGNYNGKFTWKVDGVDSLVDGTANYVDTLPSRDYPYEIIAALHDTVTGCTLTSEPFMVYVGANPTVAVSATADSVCKNDVVTLTAHVGDYNMPGLTYQWYKQVGAQTDTTVIATGTEISYTEPVADSTRYFVKVSQNLTGCYAWGKDSVYIYSKEAALKPIKLITSNASPCEGAQVTFTVKDSNTVSHPDATVSYTWTVNGVVLPNVTGTHFTPATIAFGSDSSIYDVHVVANYQLRCKDTSLVVDTVVKVYPTPSVSIIKTERYYCSSVDPIYCPTAVLNTYVPNATYTWYVDGVKVNNTPVDSIFTSFSKLPKKPQTHEFDPYELTVVVTDSASCTVTSEPVLFYYIPTNNLQVDIIASVDTLCKDSLVTLTPRILWWDPSQGIRKQLDPSEFFIMWHANHILPTTNPWYVNNLVATEITTQLKETTEYTLTFSFGDGYCKQEVKKTIYVYKPQPLYPIVLQTSNASLCDGGQVKFTVKDTNAVLYPDAAVSYQWIVNGVELPNVTGNTFMPAMPAVTVDSTIYNIHVVANYQLHCKDTSLTVDTVVNTYNVPTVSIYGDAIVCNPDGRIELTAVVPNYYKGKFTWKVDGVDSLVNGTATYVDTLPSRDYPYEIKVALLDTVTRCALTSAPFMVYVGENPTVAVSATADTTCKNNEVTLTAHIGDYNMPGLTFQWYKQVGAQTDTTEIAIGTEITYTEPVVDSTKYFVKVSQNLTECYAWGKDSVYVYPAIDTINPIALYTSAASVCNGGQITFKVIDTANRRQYFGDTTIAANYAWYINGVKLNNVTGDHFIFNPLTVDYDTTNYLVEVVASYEQECKTLTTSVDTTVTTHDNPSVVIVGDPIVCDTNFVSLRAIVNDTVIHPTFLWRVDGVDSVKFTADTFKTKLPYRDYPYAITVLVDSGTACEVVSEPFLLYVDTKPVVNVTVDYDTVCRNQMVNLTAHLGNYNQENLMYQWYVDTVAIPGATESTLAYQITKPNFTAFKVVVTQLNSNCQGTGYDTVITYNNPKFDTVLITNLQDDVYRVVRNSHGELDTINYHAYYGLPAYDVCEGASIQIAAYMKNAITGERYIDTNYTYKWRRNGVVIEGVNTPVFQEQLSIYDEDLYKYIYTVEVDEPYYPNCYAVPESASSDTVRVRRNPIVVVSGQQYVCDQGSTVPNVILQAWVNGVVDTGAVYNWYRDGQFEANPYNAQYGAMFMGYFPARYGFDYTFQVEVVTGSGCSSFSNPFGVTVMAPPVINITPYQDTVCRGGEVALVSHLNDYNVLDYELQYQWYANQISSENLIPGATSPVINLNVDTTTNYIVTVQYLTENQSVNACSAADTVTVTVYDRPVIDNIVMSLSQICEGGQVELTAVMNADHQGVPGVPYIYEWYRNSELLPANAATIFDSPVTVDGNEQQYTYSVRVYQYPDRLMCESPIYVSSEVLTVYPNPIVAISGDQSVCHTDTIILSANVDLISDPVGELHYYWYESGTPIVNLNGDSNILKVYRDAQNEPYRFSVQIERDNSATGCRSYSYEYDVYVYESPVANITVADEKVCEGAEVTVTASLNLNTPEQNNLEYQWYTKTVNDADFTAVPGATALTYTTTVNDTTSFMFKVVNTLSGCYDYDTVTVYTYEIPVVTNVTLSDSTVCEGAAITITAHIDPAKGIEGLPYFYEWRRNGELMAANTPIIHDTPTTVDGTTESFVYSVIAYQTPERLACTSQLTESAPLIVIANPRVAISGDQSVCENSNIVLSANVDTFTNVVGGLQYTWYESGRVIENLNGNSGILEYSAPARNEDYRFTVQIERGSVQRGCRAYSEEYDVHVYNAPVANVTIVDQFVCSGAEVTVSAHLDLNTPEQTNLVYQWYTRKATESAFTAVPGATGLTYTTAIDESTEFKFEVINTLSGCSDVDSSTIYIMPSPIVNYVSMSDTNICEGSQVEITADYIVANPDLPVFFEWRRNGELLEGNTATIYDSPMTVDGNEQVFTYSVIAYQTPERLSCNSQLVESAQLNVYPNPRVQISGHQYVCGSDSVFLYANVDTIGRPVGLLHYTWYESGRLRDNMAYGLGDSRFFSEYFYPQAEPYRFTVEVQRDDIAAGCRSYSEEFLVWVYNEPVVNITTDNNNVCIGQEVSLRANLNNYEFDFANDAQYQWYTVDTVLSIRHIAIDPETGAYIDDTIKTVERTIIPGATMLVYNQVLTEATTFGFSATHNLSGCSDYQEITIDVHNAPVIASIDNVLGQDTVCPGGRVELRAKIETSLPAVYTWYRNGVALESIDNTLIDYPLAVDNDVTMYVYTVTAHYVGDECESEITELSKDTIWVVPNPTIELAGDPIVCDTTDMNVVINANIVNYVQDMEYTYQWYENNVALEGETSTQLSVHRGYRDYPYSFNFAVQNEFGCTVNSEPFLVYVNDNPIVHISADDTMICENGTVTLTANLYDLNADNLVYQWYANGEAIEGAYNLTYTTTLTETSTFKFNAYQRDSHCAAYSNEVTVHVLSAPVITSVDLLSLHDTVCAGGRVELQANIAGGVVGTGTEVYTWYRNGVEVESNGNILIDYPETVNNNVTTYLYEVAVRQAASACQSEITPAFTIAVVPNPTVELAGDPIVCEANGNNVVINANVVSNVEDMEYTYQWYENNAAIDGETGLQLSIHKDYRDYPYSFNFEVKNAYGCTISSEPFLVYVNDNPVVNITADDTMICTNGVVTLFASLYDQNADNLVYQWSMNGTEIEGANDLIYSTTLDATANFTFTVKQRNSLCEATSSELTINVVDAPVVDNIEVVSNVTSICEGHVVTLKANVSGGDNSGDVVYTWYKDNEIVAGVTGDTYTDYPMAVNNAITTHVYNVTVAQTSSACFSAYDAATEVPVTVRPNAIYTIYGDADVCEGATIELNGITNDEVIAGTYTYTWYESGVVVAGQTSATLNVPAIYRNEPYRYKLVVTNNEFGCTSETAEFAVTVAQKPVVSIAADQDSVCEGGNVTLTSVLANANEAGIVYQWQSNASGSWADVEGAIAPVYVTSALNATTNFRLVVSNTQTGCVSNSNEVAVTVKSTPVIAITNVTATSVCNGGEVTLTATQPAEYAGIGEITYQWFNNGQAIAGANAPAYTTSPLTVAGDMTAYTFGVQVSMANSGCVSNVAEAVVTAYADPTVVVTYNNGLTLCEGGQTVLTANAHHAYFDTFDYQWFFQGQPINGANEATYTVENLAANQNAYEYSVEVKVNNGTQNGCAVVSEPVYVNVVNDPTAFITVNEGVNAICEGGTVTFTVNVENGVADNYNPYTYEWTSNVAGEGVVIGTDASFTTSATDAANLYVYYVNVASAYGCNVTVSDTLRIVPDPTVEISVKLGADPVVCDGGSTTLIATVQGGLGEASYQWYKNGYAIAGANNRELVTDALHVNEAAAYTVTVAQSGIACTATSTQFNVPVYEAIEVALTANSEVNCVGGSVVLTATANNGIPNDQLSYQWYRNGNPINGANAATYTTDDNLVAGLYEYQVEVASSISGCHVAQSGTIGITVEAEPSVVITSNAGNQICEGGDITLTANVIYATNATQHNNSYNYNWKWYEGTTLMSYVTAEPHFTLPATMTAGTYNFFVEISSVDGLGCDATSLANNNNFFTVVVKPVPSVVLTASSDASCEGGDVTFNAVVIPTNLTGAYYWTVNGTTTVSNSNSITVNNMVLGTNNISVVFTPNDAQNACGTASVAITHTVEAAPVVTVAATDNNRLNMCVGGTIAFNATATGTANASDNYVWTVDGQTQNGNNGTSFSTQLNTPGIHTVSAMVERAMGCSSQFSTPVVVVVAEQPVAQLTQTAGYTEMCAGGEITLMAKVANYATVNNGVTNSSVHGTYTYSWSRDNANFQTTTSTTDNSQITETLNAAAAYTYSVTITPSGFNCQAATATLDHSIVVVPDPSWSVNQVNPSEMCIGGIVTLNAEVTGGVQSQQAGRIQWYKTFNGVESEVSGLGGYNTDVPEAAGVYTYAPKYIDYIGAGCNIADATATQVTVNALPTAQLSVDPSSPAICAGDYQGFATLDITLTGTAPYTFTIMNVTSGESQTIVTSLNPYHYNVRPTVTSIYRIISVSDANGCIGTLDNVADVVVNVSDVTIAATSVVADCENWIARIPLQINAASSNTFTATLPNGNTQTGTIVFDSYTQLHYAEVDMSNLAPGAYNVVITVDGCSASCVVNVPANDASFGATVKLVDQRWDDVVVVNNNPANNGGYQFRTYQWYRNGELIPGATEQYYQEEGGLEGFYACELDGIRTSDGAHVHFVTCEKYFSAHASIRVYPVPATTSQDVTIELNLTDEELDGAILDIYDVKGAHIRSLSNLTPITKVGNFGAQGTYFGRIITGTNEIKTVKFIIVK